MAMVGVGVASAKKAAAAGTLTCSTVNATLKFAPPLSSKGLTTGTETTSIKGTVSGCKVGGGGTVSPTGGKISSKIVSQNGNSCSGFLTGASKTPEGFTTKWSPGTISPTTSVFPAGTTTGITSPDLGFKLGGKGVTETGSYTGTDGGASSTATVLTNLTSTSQFCASGTVKTLVLTGSEFSG
jgi:hypothetical protein